MIACQHIRTPRGFKVNGLEHLVVEGQGRRVELGGEENVFVHEVRAGVTLGDLLSGREPARPEEEEQEEEQLAGWGKGEGRSWKMGRESE